VTKPWDKTLVLDADGNVISTHSAPHIYESFVVYAVQNWHKHYRHQIAQAAEQSMSDARLCCLKIGRQSLRNCYYINTTLRGEVLRSFDGRALSDRRYQEIYAVVAFDLLPVFLHMLQYEKLGLDEMNFALQSACLFNRPLWVRTIIDNGASPTNELCIGNYSLLELCSQGFRNQSSAELSEIVDILLSAGLSFDWWDLDGETELNKAAFSAD
jgi:hypothetical protein